MTDDFDAGDVAALDIAEKGGAAAIDAIETRLARLEAAMASGLRGINRGLSELWREVHTNVAVVVDESSDPLGTKPAGNGDKPPAAAKTQAVASEARQKQSSNVLC